MATRKNTTPAKSAAKRSSVKKAAAKKSAAKKSTAKKSTRSAQKSASAAKKTASKKTARKGASRATTASKAPARRRTTASGASSRKTVKTSASTARATGVKRTRVTRFEQHTDSKGRAVRKRLSEPAAKAKKESLIRQKRSTGSGPTCWPGFERVLGKAAGTKGSCEPKPHQTAAERREDAREAAGSKLRRAGGNKARANRMR